jgi:serine/threonine-protein kinase
MARRSLPASLDQLFARHGARIAVLTPPAGGQRVPGAHSAKYPRAVPLTDSQPPHPPALDDRFDIQRELGRGAMAVVYLAHDRRHNRPVAIKVFHPGGGGSAGGAARFLREIDLAARLTHPHILPVYDSGEAGGVIYYVMPYVDGESLRHYLHRGERLPADEAVRLAREVADALDYAHRHAVIHRDIKPENILIEDGHAVVADFGVARALETAASQRLTDTGGAIGTPLYMSPEQAGGEPIDGRADVYSLACVLFEMPTGRPPFDGPTALAILTRRLSGEAPRLRTIDPAIRPDVEAAVARALALDPADRFATAAGFSAALASSAASAPDAARATGQGGEASIAVLPFVNMSADPDNEYLSDGITEELINALAKVPGLRVAARTSTFALKGKDHDVRALGERLRVRTLLEGSVRKAGSRLRITAQLVSAADGYHLWAETFDRNLDDVFALQDEIARTLVGTLRPQLLGTGGAPLVERGTEKLAAYTLYLRGRHFLWKRSAETYRIALNYFRRALNEDPGYARAHVGMGHAYTMLGFDEFAAMPPVEAMPMAKVEIERALELDPGLADAHARKALLTYLYDWDWARAGQEFAHAMSLDPQHTPTLHWYSMYLAAMGRHDESLWVINRAVRAEPESEYVNVQLGRCFYFAGRYDDAIQHLVAAIEMEPGSVDNAVTLARVYLSQGRNADAARLIEGCVQRAGRAPILLAFLGQAYAACGRRDDALALLAELGVASETRYIPASYQASVLTRLGDLDEGFRFWDLALQQRSGWLTFLRVEPLWREVASDPRYTALLQKLGL